MSERIIDVQSTSEPASTALVKVEAQPVAPAQNNLFGADNPVAVIAKAGSIASALKDVLKQQKLISNISGKEYPRCEAWTLLGTMLGVFPVLQWCRPVAGGWEARVEAKTRDGGVVGAAEAQCLRAERNWANRDDFALRSMAQTRATAKALRMPLGFVMTMAGYEATPAEEMAFTPATPAAKAQPQTPPPAAKKDPAPKDPPDPAKLRDRAIKRVEEAGLLELLPEYLDVAGITIPGENLDDWPEQWLPRSKEEMEALLARIAGFRDGEQAEKPFAPHGIELAAKGAAAPAAPATAKPIEVPRDPKLSEPEEWRTFPVPFGADAGTTLEDLDKKKLYGWWANYVVETEYNGKAKKPETVAKDRAFREMLDAAGEHYEFKKD